MVMLDRVRDFSDFGGVAYLNCAFKGPLPRVAEEAALLALDAERTPYLIAPETYFALPDAYRAAVAALIGCEASEVAVTDSMGYGMMLIVNGLDWSAGDEVVLAAGEFPSNRFPWKLLEPRGVCVREVEIPGGVAGAERVEACLTPRTRVVSLGWVSHASGVRRDLRAIGDVCRRRGVLLAVDGTQGVGGLPFDVRETPCDLLACSGYKWLLGPFGIGFAYIEPGLGDRLGQFNLNWYALRGARDFDRLSACALEFVRGAARFDVNETARFIDLPAATASLEYLARVTPAAAADHVAALHGRLLDALPRGYEIVDGATPASRSNILCLRHADPLVVPRVRQHFAGLDVVASVREGAVRLAPYLYNTDADVDRVLEALARAAASGRATAGAATRRMALGTPVSPSPAAGRPAHATHTGRRVSLRPLDPARDAADLFEPSHADDPGLQLWTYMGYGPFEDEAAMREWLTACAASRDPVFFAVVENRSRRAIGMVSFLRVAEANRTLEIGNIWYVPAHQRTAANTEAVYLLLREAFDRLGYRRVEWKCDALNRRSRIAAWRLGFRFEGIFRQHMLVKGRSRDTAWFAMLDHEWPSRRSDLERRLAGGDGAPKLAALTRASRVGAFPWVDGVR